MGRDEEHFFRGIIRPGMHIADVGANLGLYSLLFARLVGPQGHVYCFEPDPLMVSALRDNLDGNRITHAEVFAVAVGSANGTAVLQRSAVHSGDNRLGLRTGTAWHSEKVSVPVRSLQDALRGRRLDFIKIDVQGGEHEVLRGIGPLLEANPALKIYFEFWPHGLRLAGTEITQLAHTLRGLHLRVTLADQPANSTPLDLVALAAQMPFKGFVNLLAERSGAGAKQETHE
jgi:FkbM family methyltransferase